MCYLVPKVGRKVQARKVKRQAAQADDEISRVNQGPLRMAKANDILARQISGARGSNPGGVYEGTDGVRRYVKFYDDPVQAYCEAVANTAYRELGIDAPKTTLFRHNGKLAIATDIVDGVEDQLGRKLTKGRAQEFLKGTVADVWLANWDAVGLHLDNAVVAGKKVFRIDNGGSLLFRAQAGRKPWDKLASLTEWEGFANPSINKAYQKVIRKAGYHSLDDLGQKALNRIYAIDKLAARTNNFADLVPAVSGVSGRDRDRILDTLRLRHRLLKSELQPRLKVHVKAMKSARKATAGLIDPAEYAELARDFRGRMGNSQFNDYLQRAKDNIRRSLNSQYHLRRPLEPELKRAIPLLTDEELVALYAYSTSDEEWGYSALNKALRGLRGQDALLKLRSMAKIIQTGLAKLPAYKGKPPENWFASIRRRTILPDKELEKYVPGNVVVDPTATSAAYDTSFGGPHILYIENKTGSRIDWVSAYPNEVEVLLAPGTKFKVLSREPKDHGMIEFVLKEIESE